MSSFSFLLALLALVATHAAAENFEYRCPPGAIMAKSEASDERMCYLFERFPAQFLTAERLCRASNGHLASVENKYRNTFLAQFGNEAFGILDVKDFYIGGHDLKRDGQWEWLDHRAWTFTKWAKDEPNRDVEGADCVALSLDEGEWHAVDCYEAKPYVCELPPTKTSVPTTTTQTTTFVTTPPQTTRTPSTLTPETTTTKSSDDLCPSDDWHFDVLTGSCVLVFASQGWEADEKACEFQQATLASVHLPADTSFIKAIIHGAPSTPGAKDVSIGLVEVERDVWQWIDGTPLDFVNWDKNWPRAARANEGLRCGTFFTSTADQRRIGRWHHVPCAEGANQQAQALCRKPANWAIGVVSIKE